MVSEIRGGASYRLRDVVDSLDFNELVKMQQDLASGGFHLRKFLDKVISEKKNLHADHCATCSAPFTPTSRHNFTLVFGPDDFRKKASFCGFDCLEHFIKELKGIYKVM